MPRLRRLDDEVVPVAVRLGGVRRSVLLTERALGLAGSPASEPADYLASFEARYPDYPGAAVRCSCGACIMARS